MDAVEDQLVVDAAVIGHDDDAVSRSDRFRAQGNRGEALPILFELRNVWVVVGQLRALLLQQPDDVERGTLAEVLDVFLIGHAEHEHR